MTGLYVRGGGPDQNLILLDGVPVYNASHLFGFMSVFNTDAINSVELIKGGFPAHYGGRLSSVVDIRMKEGNNQKLHGEGSIGLIASRLTLEGPIKKNKVSFIVSGRRTYLDLFTRPISRLVIKQDGADGSFGYHFTDLNGKINWIVNDKNRLYLSAYYGDDIMDFNMSSGNNSLSDDVNANVKWGNITTALRWNHVINKKLFVNTTATFSRYHFNNVFGSTSKSYYSADSIQKTSFQFGYNSGIHDFSLRSDFDFTPSTKHSIRFGAMLTSHSFNPGISVFKSDDVGFSIDTTFGGDKIQALEGAAFFEDDMKLFKFMNANIGIHSSGFYVENKFYGSIQPRIGTNFLLGQYCSLKASFCTMTQYLHLLTNTGIGLPTDLWVPPTARVKPQQSWQAALGFSAQPSPLIELSVEGYYKEMSHMINYKEGASFLLFAKDWEDQVEMDGKGQAYGAEVFAQKKTGKITGWVGYTLSWSNRQFANLNDGKKFYYRYDRRHDFSIVMNYKISEKFELSANWVFSTGDAISLPIAEYEALVTPADWYNLYITSNADYGDKNSFRMKPTHRLDIGLTFHGRQDRKLVSTWNVSAYNAYNHFNPFFVYLGSDDSGNKQFKQVSLFPIIPSISWNFKF